MRTGNFGFIIVTILITIAMVFASPFISFALGWLVGWVIKITIGGWVVDGLNLFKIAITPNNIPLLCGTIGLLGGVWQGFKARIKTKED